MMQDLKGKRVLVTGGSRGIGEAIARGFAKSGSKVAITGRNSETLAPMVEALQADGAEAFGVACHSGKAEDRQGLFERIEREWGGLDVLVNNAATNPVMAPLAETDLGAWEKILATNLTGPLDLIQKFVPGMKAQKSGSIINIASVAGLEPAPGLGAYSVGKAALIMMTKVLAKELGSYGIRCNAIAPGLIRTKFSQALFDSKPHDDHFVRSVPMGRHGEPEEIVGGALYLAGGASSYMTGQVLVLDGGSRV